MKTRDRFKLIAGMEFEETENNPPKVSGFAIHPGIFNRFLEVPDDELENITESLKSAKLMVDHSESVRDIIGLVHEAYTTFDSAAGKQGVKYFAETDDTEILEKLHKGYIDASSIGFEHDSICSKCGENFHDCEHWFDEAHIICKNCAAFEISLVPWGADGDATANVAGLSKKSEDKFVSQFKHKLENKIKEEEVMEPEKIDQPVDVSELVSEIKKTEADVLQKDEEIESLKTKLSDLEKFKEDIQGQIDADKTKSEDEKTDLNTKLNDKTKALEELSAKVRLREAEELAEREVKVKLIKDTEVEDEIERLSKDQSIIDITTPIVAKLEAQKKENGKGKIPKHSDFNKGTDKEKFDSSKTSLDMKEPDKLLQGLIHTIFKYDTHFSEKDYMGFKKNL